MIIFDVSLIQTIMKQILLSMLIFGGLQLQAQVPGTESTLAPLNNENDSISYFLGLTLGFDLISAPFAVNQELLIQGFSEAFNGTGTISRQSAQAEFRKLQVAVQQREAEKANLAAGENQEKGRKFLEENGKREGVITTESGLQYEVLVKGDGPVPADTSTVRVHYEGFLIDGTVFDSSYERGEPVTFPLNRVVRGWTEGVQLMPVGSTYRLYIPSELGYGSRSAGSIPPNSVLIFKIELLGIE
jgi:FKBP-type peptidyl-prolyl cis-trans isomerase FkpA